MDKGDIGGLVGAILGGFGIAKLVGNGFLAKTLGPGYVIGGTILSYYAGHYAGHKLGDSHHH